MHRVLHQDFEMVPILGQQLELESFGNAINVPRLCDRLEAAHHQSADFFLVIDEAVGIADHRQRGGDAGNRLGDEIEVFRRRKRNVDAGRAAEFARPLAATVDDGLAGDLSARVATGPRDTGDMSVVPAHPCDFHAFENFRAARSRALGERLREVGRIGFAVTWNPDRARQIVGAKDWRPLSRLGR